MKRELKVEKYNKRLISIEKEQKEIDTYKAEDYKAKQDKREAAFRTRQRSNDEKLRRGVEAYYQMCKQMREAKKLKYEPRKASDRKFVGSVNADVDEVDEDVRRYGSAMFVT